MFRSALDALDVLAKMKARNVSLHMIDLGGDTTGNGISKLVFIILIILSAVAEAERDRTRERITEVTADQRKRGRYLGGVCPFGWKQGDAGELIPRSPSSRPPPARWSPCAARVFPPHLRADRRRGQPQAQPRRRPRRPRHRRAEDRGMIHNARIQLLATGCNILGVGALLAGTIVPMVTGHGGLLAWYVFGVVSIAIAQLVIGELR